MYTYISTNKREYKLCETSVILRGGKEAKVYYFIGKDREPIKGTHYAKDFPEGFEIVEEPKSGKPLVKKSRN